MIQAIPFQLGSVSSPHCTMQLRSHSVSTHLPSPALSPSLTQQTNDTPCLHSPQAIKSEPGTVQSEIMDTVSYNSHAGYSCLPPVLRSLPRCWAEHLLQQFILIPRLGIFWLLIIQMMRLRIVDNSLDRHELPLTMYHVFVHMFLELVYNQHEEPAKSILLLCLVRGRRGITRRTSTSSHLSPRKNT